MAVITNPEKRIEVYLKNLSELCCDIVNKKNRRVSNLSMGSEKYLEEKRINLIRIANKIENIETRNKEKIRINDGFERAKEYVFQAYDGKEFDVMDRDLI